MIGNTQAAIEQVSAPGQTAGEARQPSRPSHCTLLRYGGSVLLLLAALALAGCYGAPLSTREESTLLGGASGVGAGALLGSAYGAPGTGAAIGGAAGAGLGYLIGNHLQNEQHRHDWWGGQGWREGRWNRGRWGGDDDDD